MHHASSRSDCHEAQGAGGPGQSCRVRWLSKVDLLITGARRDSYSYYWWEGVSFFNIEGLYLKTSTMDACLARSLRSFLLCHLCQTDLVNLQ